MNQVAISLVELEGRLEMVCQPYNKAVQDFNEAVREIPAWLIAQLASIKALPGLALADHGAARAAARPILAGRRLDDAAAARAAGL